MGVKLFGKFWKGGPAGNENALTIRGKPEDVLEASAVAEAHGLLPNNGWGGPEADASDYKTAFLQFITDLKNKGIHVEEVKIDSNV